MSDDSQRDAVPEPVTAAPSREEVEELIQASAGRLSDRAEQPAVDVDEGDDEVYDDAEQKPVRPPKNPNVQWIDYPSVPDQFTRMPQTVRPGKQVDAVFDLSDSAQLAEFNKIQGEATDQVNGITAIIYSVDKQFHNGHFYALVTYAKLYYQKLQ